MHVLILKTGTTFNEILPGVIKFFYPDLQTLVPNNYKETTATSYLVFTSCLIVHYTTRASCLQIIS